MKKEWSAIQEIDPRIGDVLFIRGDLKNFIEYGNKR